LTTGITSFGFTQISTLDEVLKRGVLRVGIMLDFPPLGFRDEQGNPKGYSVDLAKKMAEALGVELEIIETVSANRIPALVAKRVDISISALTVTPERAKVVNFVSYPEYRSGMFILTLKDSDINSLFDCKGKTVGTVRGTTPEIAFLEYFEKFKKEDPNSKYISYDSNADQLLALRQGKVDAIAENILWFNEIMKQFPGQFKMVGPSYYVEWTAPAVRRGDHDWLHWVNTWLWDLHVRGVIKELHEKWDIPYLPVSPAYE
jgi:polar amino acid transport system substrate-binding protein